LQGCARHMNTNVSYVTGGQEANNLTHYMAKCRNTCRNTAGILCLLYYRLINTFKFHPAPSRAAYCSLIGLRGKLESAHHQQQAPVP
jgi:hypothetical protein